MRHPSLLDRQRAVAVVIDLQESYRRILDGWDGVEARTAMLMVGVRQLGVPVLLTEQYPRGLGHTSARVAEHLDADVPVIEKTTMSCCGQPRFMEALEATGRRQVLVSGIEAHACVNQTVHDLIHRGFEVHLARDTTGSRHADLVEPAWERMRSVGMLPTTAEQALLELVRTAEAPEFRTIQGLLKESSP